MSGWICSGPLRRELARTTHQLQTVDACYKRSWSWGGKVSSDTPPLVNTISPALEVVDCPCLLDYYPSFFSPRLLCAWKKQEMTLQILVGQMLLYSLTCLAPAGKEHDGKCAPILMDICARIDRIFIWSKAFFTSFFIYIIFGIQGRREFSDRTRHIYTYISIRLRTLTVDSASDVVWIWEKEKDHADNYLGAVLGIQWYFIWVIYHYGYGSE